MNEELIASTTCESILLKDLLEEIGMQVVLAIKMHCDN